MREWRSNQVLKVRKWVGRRVLGVCQPETAAQAEAANT